jgi:hypothetical protein
MNYKHSSITIVIISLALLTGCINLHKSIIISESTSYSLADIVNLQSQIISPFIVFGDDIYVHTKEYVYSINSADWKINWRSKCPGYMRNSSLFVSKSFVFAPDKYGNIFQFDRLSGLQIRTFEISKWMPHVIRAIDAIYSPGETLIVGYSGSTVIAWDISTGERIWDFGPTPKSYIYILGYDNKVVVGTNDSLQVLDLDTGILIKSLSITSPVSALYNLSNNYYMFITSKDEHSTISVVNKDGLDIEKKIEINTNEVSCISKINENIYLSGQGVFELDNSFGSIKKISDLDSLGCVSSINNKSLVSFEWSEKLVFLSKSDKAKTFSHNYYSNLFMNLLLRIDPIILGKYLLVPVGSNIYIYSE